jgi:hypothetical protein
MTNVDHDDDDRMEEEYEDEDEEWPPEIRSKFQPMKIPFGLPRPPPPNAPLFFLQEPADQPPGLAEGAPASVPKAEDGFIFVQLPTRLPTTVVGDTMGGPSSIAGAASSADATSPHDQGSNADDSPGAAMHDRVLTNVSHLFRLTSVLSCPLLVAFLPVKI